MEAYKEIHGHYPELVQADQIYATQENRRWLKQRGIRITAPPLGRKPAKEKQSYYQKRKARKEAAERNHIEGKFGQGKNGYDLNQIRAKLRETSESWVACIFFVMNLIHYEANHFFGSISGWLEAADCWISSITAQLKSFFSEQRMNLGVQGREMIFC